MCRVVDAIDSSLRLLYALVQSAGAVKTLSAHLADKPAARDWLASGVGRIASTYVPDWVEDIEAGARLDQLAGQLLLYMAHRGEC
jgi:hypothetical protein